MDRFTRRGVTVWVVCALFFLYEFLLRTVVGTFQHPIMYDLELTSFKFSILSTTTYVLIYGLMQVPVGLIIERFGLKKTLLFACFICVIATFGFAYSTSFIMAVFFRFLTGFGCSFGFICLLVSVYDWLPKKNIAFLLGLSQFFGTMGPMLSAGPLESLSESGHVNWRHVFTLLSMIGFLISILVFFFVENNHEKTGGFTILKRPEPVLKTLKTLASQAQPWMVALFSAGAYFSIEYLSENEGRNILISKNFSPSTSAYVITLAWFSYAIGCPLFGYLSDKLQRRRLMILLTILTCVVSIVMMMYATTPLMLGIAFVLLGLGGSGQSLGFATIAEHYKKQYLATALGLNNAIMMIFSSLNAPMISLYIDMIKEPEMLRLTDYTHVLTILLFITGATFIASSLFIKETFCKSQMSFTILDRKTY
tara:strand:- start:3232 stop:4500 length:1269 start_codon:yes stop_codon:yes gene_type:complete